MKFSNKNLGRFEIQRKLGSGAFGTVYLALDPQLDRTVALKIPHFSGGENTKQISRFLREAKAAAGLHHPNIVAVHDAGRLDEHYYIASAYVDGTNLREMIQLHGKPTATAAVKLILKLANALGYAHLQGVVHRDVKPENILLDKEGTPYLVDFGLAKRDIIDVLHTQEGAVLGTPAYMSPEQASGKSSVADGQTDQWSLGIMLFELLTGKRPFEGAQLQLMYAIQHSEVPSLRKLNPQIPVDLETICLKALQKTPKDRFQDCFELARDLDRWLTDAPILSRRQSIIEKLQRWSRRNPGISKLTAAFLVVVTILSVAVLTQWIRAEVNAVRISQTLFQVENQKRKLETQSQELEQRSDELDQQNQTLNQNNIALEGANATIVAKLREIQEKEKLILSTAEQKAIAEQEADQAKAQSEDEKQLRQTEQSKNKTLKYFGEIQTVKMEIASARFDSATKILQDTVPAARSLEWTYLSTKAKQRDLPYKLVDDFDRLDIETVQFIRSVHFPDRPVDRVQIKDLASGERVLAVNQAADTWITQDPEESLIAEYLPRSANNKNVALSKIAQEFTAKKIRVASYGKSVTSIDEVVTQAWISPNGNYVACVCPKVTVSMKNESNDNPLDDVLLIDIDLEMVLLNLASSEYPRRVIPVDQLAKVSISITENPVGSGLYVPKYEPLRWPEMRVIFSEDSSQLILLNHSGNLSSYSINDQSIQKDASKLGVDQDKETALCFAKNGDCILATDGEVLQLEPTTLKTIRSIKLKWPRTPRKGGAMFSRNGTSLGLIVSRAGTKPQDEVLQFHVYNFERKEWNSCNVTGSMMTSAFNLSEQNANRDFRAAAADKQVYLADFIFDDFVDDRLSRWVSFRLKNGQHYFFKENTESLSISDSEIWKGPSDKPPVLMKYDSEASTLFLGFIDRLVTFKSEERSKLKLHSNISLEGGGGLLDMTFSQSGGGVAVSQKSRIGLVDLGSRSVVKSFATKQVSAMCGIPGGRLACSDCNGELRIVSESDGEVLRSFQVNRNGRSRLAVSEKDDLLVSVGEDRRVVVWDLRNEKQIGMLLTDTPSKQVRMNQKSNMLTIVGIDNSITVHQLPSMRRVASFQSIESDVLWCNTSDDGKRLVKASTPGVDLLDLEFSVGVLELVRFPGKPLCIEVDCSRWVVYAYMPDGRLHEFAL